MHLRRGGIFNDFFIANFLENVTVNFFENQPVFDKVMCTAWSLTVLAHPVLW